MFVFIVQTLQLFFVLLLLLIFEFNLYFAIAINYSYSSNHYRFIDLMDNKLLLLILFVLAIIWCYFENLHIPQYFNGNPSGGQ